MTATTKEKVREVMIGKVRYRLPYIDLVPCKEGQREQLKAALEEEGRITVPIICWKEKSNGAVRVVIDGANRVLLAKELKIARIPMSMESYPNEEAAMAACKSINCDRRQIEEDAPVMQAHLQERQERILVMRQEGDSVRKIAEKEGVSPSTIQRNLDAAGAAAPEKVKGKDEKDYPASKPAPLCPRCQRVGSTPGCAACKELRENANKTKAKKAKATRARNAESNGDVDDKDHFGNLLPDKLKHVFLDPWVQDTFDFLNVISEQVRGKKIINGMHQRAKKLPFIESQKLKDHVGQIINDLDKVIDHLKEYRPAGVCPSCEGKGCSHCHMSGLVPRKLYQELKKEKKELAHGGA
jgi:hypothetical protein